MVQSKAAAGASAESVTSNRLFKRAMHYRYAAALADDPHKRRQMLDLASMFQRLAKDFKRHEGRRLKLVTAANPPDLAKVRAVSQEAPLSQ